MDYPVIIFNRYNMRFNRVNHKCFDAITYDLINCEKAYTDGLKLGFEEGAKSRDKEVEELNRTISALRGLLAEQNNA